MKRVMNESAAKRCYNCRRVKGDHRRVLGLLLCPKLLNRFHPSTMISAITYCYCGGRQLTIEQELNGKTFLQTAEIIAEIAALSTETDKPLENPLREPTGTVDVSDVMSPVVREIEEEINEMISGGSPCQS